MSLRHPRTLKEFAILAIAIMATVAAVVAGGIVIRYGFAVNKLGRGMIVEALAVPE